MLIHRSLLAAVLPATNQAGGGPAAVRVLPTGTAEATNGHLLLQATDAAPADPADFPTTDAQGTDPGGPVVVPAAPLVATLKHTKGRRLIPVMETLRLLVTEDDTIRLSAGDVGAVATIPTRPEEGCFPATAHLWRDAAARPTVVHCHLSLANLKILCAAAAALCDGNREEPILKFAIPADAGRPETADGTTLPGYTLDPITVTLTRDGRTLTALVMPCRP